MGSGQKTTQQQQKSDDQDPPLSKKGRRTLHSGESCVKCVVWLTLGANPETHSSHKIDKRAQHPQENAAQFSKYLSVNNKVFSLRADSCMCNACYNDCKRNVEVKDKTPRWVHADNKSKQTDKDCCPICYFELLQFSPGHRTPSKFSTTRWGAQDWFKQLILNFWKKYFSFTRPGFNMRLSESSRLCHRHYMETYNLVNHSVCKVCSSTTGLTMLFDDVTSLHNIEEGSDVTDVGGTDWICDLCITSSKAQASNKEPSEEQSFIKQCVTNAIKDIQLKELCGENN